MFRFIVMVCLLTFTSCSQNSQNSSSSPATSSVFELTGSSAERVERVTAQIAKHRAPPTAIVDAQFLEEKIGDGQLGPSDFRSFYRIDVAPKDLAEWTAMLTPLGKSAEYAAPSSPRDWWIGPEDFDSLQFFQPDVLTGNSIGWIGISQQTGRIYIFTMTI